MTSWGWLLSYLPSSLVNRRNPPNPPNLPILPTNAIMGGGGVSHGRGGAGKTHIIIMIAFAISV